MKALIRPIICAILAIIGTVLTHMELSPPAVIFAIFAVAYVLAGCDILIGAVKDITEGEIFGERMLMSIASLGAFIIGDRAEACAVIILYQIGEWLAEIALDRSRASIEQMMDIRPDHANLIADGEIVRTSPENVRAGDAIRVLPGERIPLDGVLFAGSSAVDTASLTGESAPRDVAPGDSVLSGCVNLSGVIDLRVSAEYSDSAVARILALTSEAAERKSKTERFMTRFARVYTPIVTGAALVLGVVVPLIFGLSMQEWLYRGLVFLVVSCPCALVISVPLSYFSGIGRASKNGILIKGGGTIDTLARVGAVAFDKTGTLTSGAFSVTNVAANGNYSHDQLMNLAAIAEAHSTHPIATAICQFCRKKTDIPKAEQITEIPGEGIACAYDKKQLLAGNYKLLQRYNIFVPDSDSGGTHILIAYDGAFAGRIDLADSPKPTAKAAVTQLTHMGVNRIVMLTGDREPAARDTAGSVGIKEYYAGLLPDGKYAKLERLEQKLTGKSALMFVGDGVNDAPVLARADVGAAMGGVGSDAAVEAADLVIMNDDPLKIPLAIKIARQINRTVKQNIVLALAVKSAVQVFGALGLIGMWAAVIADVGVMLIAVGNSILPRKLD